MTAKQIQKKLEAAGIEITKEIEIARDEVTVCIGYYEVNERYGWCNEKKTRTLANKIGKALGWKNGYRTGYGAQVVTGYKVNIDSGNCL